MFSYENGLILSLLLYIYYIISLLISINSQFERNLNKVGERISWLSLTIKPMSKSDINRSFGRKIVKFLFIAAWQGIFVFLSWINVFLNLIMLVYRLSKDSGAPQKVKELRWKLRNYDLSFDEIIKEILKAKGVEEAEFDLAKQELEGRLAERGLMLGNVQAYSQ